MDRNPLIGVIIPVYNVENYIERCINSVICQTYHNLEIILIDDGSTDNSGRICDEYAGKERRIHVIHQKNSGLSAARNVGIKVSSAEYIAFIDSDDYVSQWYIQRLTQILFKYDADMAICGYYQGKRKEFPEINRVRGKIHCFDSQTMLKNWHGKYKHVETSAWNKLYKKALFVEKNIYYPAGYFHEDVQTTHLLVDKAQKIVITDEKLYYYYERNGSIVQTLSEKRIEDCIYSQNRRLDFFKHKGYTEAYERMAIKRQKQYMLSYLKSAPSAALYNVSAEMIDLYNKSYKQVCRFKTIKMWECLLFFIFRHFYSVIRILNGKKQTAKRYDNKVL